MIYLNDWRKYFLLPVMSYPSINYFCSHSFTPLHSHSVKNFVNQVFNNLFNLTFFSTLAFICLCQLLSHCQLPTAVTISSFTRSAVTRTAYTCCKLPFTRTLPNCLSKEKKDGRSHFLHLFYSILYIMKSIHQMKNYYII